jgi:hypothetical protein
MSNTIIVNSIGVKYNLKNPAILRRVFCFFVLSFPYFYDTHWQWANVPCFILPVIIYPNPKIIPKKTECNMKFAHFFAI